jgi:hypothetical protein
VGVAFAIDNLTGSATLPHLMTAQNLNCARHGSTRLFHFRNGAVVACDRIDASLFCLGGALTKERALRARLKYTRVGILSPDSPSVRRRGCRELEHSGGC